MSELESRWQLPDANLDGMWFVDISAVNLRDLANSRPGSIVPCKHFPAVQYVPAALQGYDRIAGLISDAS